MTARAWSQPSWMIWSSIARASAKSLRASSPFSGVVEDLRVAALELPGVEEEGPVDEAGDVVEGDVVEDLDPGLGRGGRRHSAPSRWGWDWPGPRRGGPGRAPRPGRRGAPHLVIVGADSEHIHLPQVLRQQAPGHAHGPGGVLHMDHGLRVVGLDLHRGVQLGGGRAADQQRDGEALALHLLGHVDHLVQRGGDEAGQADDVDLDLPRLGEDLLGRDHDAHVDHVVVVALEHHADDVLADVVHVALDGGHAGCAPGCRPRTSPAPGRAPGRPRPSS